MPTIQDADTQINQLWEEVGKTRLIIGDDDKNIGAFLQSTKSNVPFPD